MKKLSIATFIATVLILATAHSAFATSPSPNQDSDTATIQALTNYESEPNDNYESADTAVLYEWDNGTNYGYISSMGDLDFWHLPTNNASSYNISLYSPDSYFNYNFAVYEKVSGQNGYIEVARSYAINGVAGVSVPGLKSDGTIPNYYVMVYGNMGFNILDPYRLTIHAVY